MLLAPSSDGVSVAVHDLAGEAGPDHPLLLVAHATGFHGWAYQPLATHLAPPFHVVAADLRGHGDTAPPPAWKVAWDDYGDDATAVADRLAAEPGGERGLVAFGHSMGGAALLMAAARRPERFRMLVLFEPIAFPADEVGPGEGPGALVVGARRRRATFPTFEEAIANFASKPPLGAFDPAALEAYVRHGFRPDADGIRLKCDPEVEARTFELGAYHSTWDVLPEVSTPTVVISGRVGPSQPSAISERIAGELPAGRYVLDGTLDHFGPFTQPAHLAAVVRAALDERAG